MAWNDSNVSLAVDPADRFAAVAVALACPAAISVADLHQVIASAAQPSGPGPGPALDSPPVVEAVAQHVAQHSVLTAQAARALVLPILQGAQARSTSSAPEADPGKKAAAKEGAAHQAAHDIAAALPAINGDIELGDPVMLNSTARIGFAGVFALFIAAAVALIGLLGLQQPASSSAALGLMVLGLLSLVAVLVLVMGYKNVTIKGGTGGAAPAGPPAGS